MVIHHTRGTQSQATIKSFSSATCFAACARIASPFSPWSSSRAAWVFSFLDCPFFRTSRRASASASALIGKDTVMSLDKRQALLQARVNKAMNAYGTALFTFYEYFKSYELAVYPLFF